MKVYVTFYVYDPVNDEQSRPKRVFNSEEKALIHIKNEGSMNYHYLEMELE